MKKRSTQGGFSERSIHRVEGALYSKLWKVAFELDLRTKVIEVVNHGVVPVTGHEVLIAWR